MYSTKFKCNPKAIQPPNYITIGDTYEKKQNIDSRFKGKQLECAPPKKGQLKGYFSNFQYPSGAGLPSVIRYLDIVPADKRSLGFGSKDAFKSDEFTNHTRVIQWKETLETESSFAAKWRKKDELKQQEEELAITKDARDVRVDETKKQTTRELLPHLFQTKVPKHLYDIGKESGGLTPSCNKCSRETFYCVHRVGKGSVTARRLGPVHIESMVIGSGEQDVVKPKHGSRQYTRDFFDAGHLGISEKAFSFNH